ncbi:hypothetical protein BH10PSE4_BH10PSE4_05770 [soil metagenome]
MTRHMLGEEADRLARQMAEQTGDTFDEVVMRGLRAKAERTPKVRAKPLTREEKLAVMAELQRRSAVLPVLDPRYLRKAATA